MRARFPRFLISLALLLAAATPLTCAQASGAIDLEQQRQLFAVIGKNWRFHPGDSPAWSQPSFDDSSWKILQPNSEWNAQGYSTQDGMSWFRFRLRVPAGLPSLVVLLPRIDQSYQLFADGRLIGQVGILPPDTPRQVIAAARVFTVPVQQSAQVRDITFAIRMWQAPEYEKLHHKIMQGRPYAGEPSTVLRQFALTNAASLLSKGSEYTQDIIILIVGAAALLLYLLTRQNFYLWFAVYNGLYMTFLPIALLSQHFAWNYTLTLFVYILQDFAANAAFSIFLLKSLNLGQWREIVPPVLLIFFAELGPLLLITWKMPLVWANGIYFTFAIILQLLLLTYLVRGWRAGMVDAKLLLFPYAISALIGTADNLGHFLTDLHVPHADTLLAREISLLKDPFRVTISDIGSIVSLLGFLAILVYRFARTSHEQQRLSAALQTAHDVQHRLIPLELPAMGGLHTDVVYLAAEEVGGDFCQVLPRLDGSILVAVGDVSGKGLQAAMLGTFAVGALRSIADEAIDPCATLERLNQVLMRAGHTGFTTCLCLVLTRDGEVTIANAGHLSPYLDGREVELDAGLPLGIIDDPQYTQITFRLAASARLTLISDGVVEARSHSGELFGFERTSGISELPASQIAAQAKTHGQQDDITVVTLDWHRVSVPAATVDLLPV